LSGEEKIVNFIQEMQLKIENQHDIVFEWIPYNQFGNIKEIGKNDFMTAYLAVWKDGPLYYNKEYNKYVRGLNKEVALKCLHNSQNPVEFVINEVQNLYNILMFFIVIIYLFILLIF
jgi:hypothetical protein